jgi:hypothetical protein
VVSPPLQGSRAAPNGSAETLNNAASVSLLSHNADKVLGAGVLQSASLGDLAWNDLNANGFQASRS